MDWFKDRELKNAVKNGDTKRVEELLRINPQRLHLGDVLLEASANGHKEIVRALISAGADVNFTKEKGSRSALCIASENGQKEIVHILLDAGAKTQLGDALLEASANGHKEIVRALISAGADVNFLEHRDGALFEASAKGYNGIMLALISAGADVNLHEDLKSPLFLASIQGYIEIVLTLLLAGAIGDAREVVCHAVVANSREDDGIDACLAYSLTNEDRLTKIINTLIEIRNKVKEPAIARRKLYQTIVKELLRTGSKKDLNIGLSLASKFGLNEMVDSLISQGADVNYTLNNLESPLSLASKEGHIEVVLALLQAGAKGDAREAVCNAVANRREANDIDACLAYPLANEDRRTIVINTLMEIRDNVNDPATARRKLYQTIVKVLLSTGSKKDLNIGLPIASKFGLNEMVDSLISQGADVKYTLDNGMSAMQLALQNGHREVVRKLLLQRAKIDSSEMFCEMILDVYNRFRQRGRKLLDRLLSAEYKICQADTASLPNLVKGLTDYAIKITKQELKQLITLTFKMTGSDQIFLLCCQDVEQHPGPLSAERDTLCRSCISDMFLFYWGVSKKKEFTFFIKASYERKHMNFRHLYSDENKPNNWDPKYSFDDPSNAKKQSSMMPCEKTSMLLGILTCCHKENKIPTKQHLDKLEALLSSNDNQLKEFKRKVDLEEALQALSSESNQNDFQQLVGICLQKYGLQIQQSNDSRQHDQEVTEDSEIRKTRLENVIQALQQLTQTLEDEIGQKRPGRKRKAPDSSGVQESILEMEEIYSKKPKSCSETGN